MSSCSKTFTLILIAILLAVGACKKNQPFQGPKLYHKYDMRAANTTTYTYNSDGSIQKISCTAGGDTNFYYSGDTVLENDYFNGALSGGYLYFKNSSGWADSAVGVYGLQELSYYYSYDAYDMFTQTKQYLKTGSSPVLQVTYNYTNSGKNIYELNTVDATNGTQTYDYYTFFSSNTNSIGVQNQGKYHLGASATSPTSSDIFINNSKDTIYTIKYRYAYDGSGRIDTMVGYKTLYGELTGTQVDSLAFDYY